MKCNANKPDFGPVNSKAHSISTIRGALFFRVGNGLIFRSSFELSPLVFAGLSLLEPSSSLPSSLSVSSESSDELVVPSARFCLNTPNPRSWKLSSTQLLREMILKPPYHFYVLLIVFVKCLDIEARGVFIEFLLYITVGSFQLW
jgi:hypothetical protein